MLTAIIGGGISGLTCAFELQRRGHRVLLLEQSTRTGGVIASVEQDGFLFELGPQSFLSGEALLKLISALGIGQDLQRGDPRAARYILLGGKLRRLPMAPPGLLTTPLLGLGSKLRLFAEAFLNSQPPDGDESVADFVRRKFGSELLENLVGPFVSGVYAGDPERLSMRAAFPALHELERSYASVIRGAIKNRPAKGASRPMLCSLRGGLATLTNSLTARLGDNIRPGVTVEAVRRGKANGSTLFELHLHGGGRAEIIEADAVVVSAPGDAAARFLGTISNRFGELLGRIEYAPVAVALCGYRREHGAHPLDGFGFLVPRKEGLSILGTVWSSSLFPGRAPEGMVSLASFVGGATNPAVLDLSDDALLAAVEKENAAVLGITHAPVTRLLHRHRRAIPQYNMGHPQVRKALREEAAQHPGLFFAANYVEGPAIPACVDQAIRVAESVAKYLASR